LLNPMGGTLVGVRVIQHRSHLEAVTENHMPPFQTNQGTFSHDMVTRVGSAAGLVARIQQDYAVRAEAEPADGMRQALADKARADAERVIDEQGISIQDYNAVLQAAETDQDLERQLVSAAREVL
jgi:hypothetical protein